MTMLGVKELKRAKTKRGTDYYSFRGYEDGRAVDCKVWDIGEELKNGDIIECNYTEDKYNGVTQYKISDYTPICDIDNEQKGEIFGVPVVDTEEEVKGIEKYCNKTIKNEKYLKLLASTIFKGGIIHEEFKTSTAAKGKHHDYEGGLCHHTCCVFKICVSYSNIYDVDKDLIVTAALLHDIGKIYTYEKTEEGAYDFSEYGHLFEHLTYGAIKVKDWWKEFEIGDEDDMDLKLLMHCIMAHHGQREWASPVEPALPEAQLVHLADLADSRIEMMFVGINENNNDGYFTDRVYPLSVCLFDRKAYDRIKGEENE